MKRLLQVSLLLSLSLTVSCGSFIKKTAIDSTGMIIEDLMGAFFSEEDIIFAEQSIPGNLKLLEGLLRGSPDNEKLLLMASRFYTSYAFAYLEKIYVPEDKEEDQKINNARAKIFYKRGLNFGLKVLNKNPGFTEAIEGNSEDFGKYLSTMDKNKLPEIFWTAYAWGNLINLSKEDTDALVNLAKVEVMMKRVIELDETYYHGSAHLFYMIYYGSRPTMLGGNPEKANVHYNKAKEITQGKFLIADYLYAAYCTVQNQDQELFKTTLQKVVDTSGDILPDERLTNEIARKRAQELLQLEAEIF